MTVAHALLLMAFGCGVMAFFCMRIMPRAFDEDDDIDLRVEAWMLMMLTGGFAVLGVIAW